MNNIVIYSTPMKVTLATSFNYSYVVYDNSTEDIIPYVYEKSYKEGNILIAIAIVKSATCVNGYGYLIFDEELEDSFIVDVGLFATDSLLN